VFGKILIANRGEIACRVMRSAERLGIRTVAVYSDADRDALHVKLAHEARRIGLAPARESYLNAEAVIAAARETGAEAIHPGYGFLSENEAFARACAAAGIVFIGPTPEAIAAMGDKSAAKALMEKTRVPLVPGYHGENQDAGFLLGRAEAIGFPVLIKASAGGGGKGMRIVRRGAEFEAVVAVVLVIVQQAGDLVPHRAPRLAGQAQPSGKSGRIAKRKIKAKDCPLAARCNRFEDGAQGLLGAMARVGVLAGLAVLPAVADPDAVAARLGAARGAPIDDDVMVEQSRHRRSAGVVGMIVRMCMIVIVMMSDAGAAHMVVMALLRRADGAMYQAKAGGRNRFHLA